jgi:hypothetical protein
LQRRTLKLDEAELGDPQDLGLGAVLLELVEGIWMCWKTWQTVLGDEGGDSHLGARKRA